jgi:hypothetical protein
LTNERNARKMFQPIIKFYLSVIKYNYKRVWRHVMYKSEAFRNDFFIKFWNEIKRLILTYFKSHKNRLISVLIVVIRTLYMHGLYNNNQFRVKTKKTIEMYKPCHVWLILCWSMDVFTWRLVASQLVDNQYILMNLEYIVITTALSNLYV